MRDVAAPAEADAASSQRCRSWSRTRHARLSGGRFGPGGELVCEQKGSVAGPATPVPPRARGRVVRHVSAAGGGRVARSAVSVLRLGLGCLRSWVRERAAWEVAWWGGVRSSEGQAGDEPGPHHTGALERVTRGALAASRRLGARRPSSHGPAQTPRCHVPVRLPPGAGAQSKPSPARAGGAAVVARWPQGPGERSLPRSTTMPCVACRFCSWQAHPGGVPRPAGPRAAGLRR